MNYNAKHGCQRCQTIGKYSGLSNTVVFPQTTELQLRTDEVFRGRGYPDHQNAETCLTELPALDMVRDFVVADPLHLLELGVQKRLITGWMSGNLACPSMSPGNLQKLDQTLVKIDTPREINRGVRRLSLFRVWTGTEFRNFLLYYGFVAMKEFLLPEYYKNYLKLFCAVRLASSEKYMSANYTLIEILFADFVKEFKTIYGVQFITSNIHNVLHIHEDVKRFGILSSISAYPFESCLGKIKRLIRSGPEALSQVAV